MHGEVNSVQRCSALFVLAMKSEREASFGECLSDRRLPCTKRGREFSFFRRLGVQIGSDTSATLSNLPLLD